MKQSPCRGSWPGWSLFVWFIAPRVVTLMSLTIRTRNHADRELALLRLSSGMCIVAFLLPPPVRLLPPKIRWMTVECPCGNRSGTRRRSLTTASRWTWPSLPCWLSSAGGSELTSSWLPAAMSLTTSFDTRRSRRTARSSARHFRVPGVRLCHRRMPARASPQPAVVRCVGTAGIRRDTMSAIIPTMAPMGARSLSLRWRRASASSSCRGWLAWPSQCPGTEGSQ